jgi:hypothetical protein
MFAKEARGEKRAWPKRGARSSPAEKPAKEIAANSTGLIELQVAPSDGRIELELRGGCRVRIPVGFDPRGLRDLLDVLEAR